MTTWLIGSAPECDVVIDQQAVSGRHCRLTQRADGFYLEDLQSTNGTYVNGQRLSSARRVSPDDKITLGQKLPLPWPVAMAASAARIVSIGQSSDNDVVLDRPAVSGHHARIVIRGSEVILEDLGSTNGTFVGSTSQRIQSKAVRLDDKVFFGSYKSTIRELLARSNITIPEASAKVRPATMAATVKPAAKVSASTAPSVEKMNWSDYLLPAVAGAALLVICVVGVLMMLSSSSKPDVANTSLEASKQTANEKQSGSNGNDSGVRTKFRMGKYDPDHVVKRIKVSIRVGADEQHLEEAVDLDLGGGFLLRLSPATTDVPADVAVAFPQKSSLKPKETVAAGKAAWFEFSADDEENSEGEFSATPQVLDDFSFSQIRRIRFAAQGKTAWVLEGYEIEINGELFASHDSVNWAVKKQRRLDQTELAALLAQQAKLEEEISAAEIYVQQGLGEASDERHLEEKKKEHANLAAAIKGLRSGIASEYSSYDERDLAFRPGSAAAPSQQQN